MLFRMKVLAAILAVSACSTQSGSLQSIQSGAPTQAATSAAQSTCPNATFYTQSPNDASKYWFLC